MKKKRAGMKDLKVRKDDAKKVTGGGLSSATSDVLKNFGGALSTAARG